MRIALITDTHFGARNDSKIFADYFDRFYYNYFFPELQRQHVDTIIHLGDFCDRRKYINYGTLNQVNRFFDYIVEHNFKFHWIIGNHDTFYKSTNRINAANEFLKTHFTLASNLFYYERPTEVEFDGIKLAFLPWIAPDIHEETMEFISKTKAQIALGHLDIQGFEMYKGSINEHGYSRDVFNKFDMVMSGHFHHKSTYSNIWYLGSAFEITWSDYNDPRGFHIFDTETRELEFIQNPYKMFNKLYYDDSKSDLDMLLDSIKPDEVFGHILKLIIVNKTNPYWYDQYIAKLESCQPSELQTVEDNLGLDLIDEYELIENTEDTLQILTKYSEQYADRVDSTELALYLKKLYSEALMVE